MQLDTMHAVVADGIAVVTLNRPAVLNCIDERWTRDLNAVLDDLGARSDVRVVVLRGAGRAFCSGLDLTALSHGEIGSSFFRTWELTLRRIETMDALVIAAVHSYCLGGGLQLALACDVRIARADARFALTAIKEGILPGMGMWRMARYAGLGRTKRFALSAETIDAATAAGWGLVDEVVESDSFDARIAAAAAHLRAIASPSTLQTKHLANLAFDLPFAQFLEAFDEGQRRALASNEHQQAMARRRAARSAATTHSRT